MDRQQQFVLRTLEERDIRFVRLWFTDVLGFLKSVAVAPAELEGAFSEGIGFDGSAIEGFARVFESDMVARPDPATFQVLPWEADAGRVYSARMFCDITMPDGSPSWADPRHVLRRAMGEAAAMGFTCYVHPEIEFFLLKDLPDDGSVPEPADTGGFFDQRRRTSVAGRSKPLRRWVFRWSSRITRGLRASRRSTCGTPTRSPWRTTSCPSGTW
jgi:glutamine synthetase